MKFLKLSIFFIISFLISFILLRTFSQDVFKAAVPARILGYTTPVIPIYIFIAGSFLLGLFIGLAVAVYYFIVTKAESLKKSKKIKELTKEVTFLSEQQKQSQVESAEELPDLVEDAEEEIPPAPRTVHNSEAPAPQNIEEEPEDEPLIDYDPKEQETEDWGDGKNGDDDTDEDGKPLDDTVNSYLS